MASLAGSAGSIGSAPMSPTDGSGPARLARRGGQILTPTVWWRTADVNSPEDAQRSLGTIAEVARMRVAAPAVRGGVGERRAQPIGAGRGVVEAGNDYLAPVVVYDSAPTWTSPVDPHGVSEMLRGVFAESMQTPRLRQLEPVPLRFLARWIARSR